MSGGANYYNLKVTDIPGDTLFEGYCKVVGNVVTEAYNYNFNRNAGTFPDSNPSNIATWTNCLAAQTDYYSSRSTNNAAASDAAGGGNYDGLPVNNSFDTSPFAPNVAGPQFSNDINTSTFDYDFRAGAFGLPVNGFILDMENLPESGKQFAVKDYLYLSIFNTDTGYGNPNYFQVCPVGSDATDQTTPGQTTASFCIQNPYTNFANEASYYLAFNPLSDVRYAISITALSGDPSCFLENTAILCFCKTLGQEKYLPIQTLRVGDLVKTYKNGYRTIKNIGKSYMFNDPHIWYSRLYVLKKTEENGLIEDVVMTGGHGIMVDKYSPEILKPHAGKPNRVPDHALEIIDNKTLVLAAEHKDTIGYTDTDFYTVYHLTLDNDGIEHKRFCIWANGMLSETPSEYQYKANEYIDLDEEHYFQLENGIPEEKLIANKERAMFAFKLRINSCLQHHYNTQKTIENQSKDLMDELSRTQKIIENKSKALMDELSDVKFNTESYKSKVSPILEKFTKLKNEFDNKLIKKEVTV